MRIRSINLAVIGVVCLMAGRAAAASNDRMDNATQLTVGQTLSPSLVREWDPYRITTELVKDASGQPQVVTHVGGWRDLGNDNAPLAEQMGGYWFYVEQIPNQDQVVALTLREDMVVSVSTVGDGLHPDLSRTTDKGTTYYYIPKSAWRLYHVGVKHYFRVFSAKKGSVGEQFTVSFKQQSIRDFVTPPGSLDQPIEIPMATGSGSLIIEEPTDEVLFYGFIKLKPTAYVAELKANTTYTFWGDATSADGMDVFINLYDGEWRTGTLNFPGQVTETWNDDHSAVTRLQLVPNQDVKTKILVSPDIYHNALTATGRTLFWATGEVKAEVETFVGQLKSVDSALGGSPQTAFFEVDVKTTFGIETNLAARVTVGNRCFTLDELAKGRLGDSSGSVFAVTASADGKLHVSGSLVISDLGEYFFDGDLINGAYTVVYDPGEGSGEMPDQPCRWGKVYSLDACGFSAPSGKTNFSGWRQAPKSGVGGKFYDPGMLIFNLPHESDGKVVFRAVWK